MNNPCSGCSICTVTCRNKLSIRWENSLYQQGGFGSDRIISMAIYRKIKMRRAKIVKGIVLLVSVLLSNNANGQDFLFPPAKGFKIEKSYPVYTPGDLWDYINGAADAYLSYGFSELHIAEYVKGKNAIKVEVYDHVSPLLGFGIYSIERSPQYRFIDIGSQGYAEEGLAHFFKGRYYVKVVTNSKSKKIITSLNQIARSVADALPGDAAMPEMIRLLPVTGKVAYEETYLNESVLGHSFLRGALRAAYEIDDKSFSMYLFKTESVGQAAEAVAAYLKSAGIEADSDVSGKYKLKDGYNGIVYLVWNRDMFAILTGLGDGMEAFAGAFCDSVMGEK